MQNNLLFDDIHYYLNLMIHIESLKQKAEYQVLAEDVPQEQLKEITNMRNRIFTGLLRCGFEYEYIKDADTPEKDIIRFTIDNINYDCFVKAIKNILKEDFKLFIKEADIYNRTIDLNNNPTISKSSRKKKNIKTQNVKKEILDETTIDNKMAELALVHEIEKKEENNEKDVKIDGKDIITDFYSPELRDNMTQNDKTSKLTDKNISEDNKKDNDNKKNIQKEDIVTEKNANSDILTVVTESSKSTNNSVDVENNSILENQGNDIDEIEEICSIQYEMSKDINSFVYDIVEIEIFQPGATIGEKMLLNIMPIKIEENNIRPKIAVAISSVVDGKVQDTMVFASKATSVIQLDYKGYQLLIRGTFKKGVFTSYVIASGTTAAIGCSINNKVTKIRGKENVNYGHICFEENNSILHVLPLSNKNEENGFSHFMICIEENNQLNVIQNINGNAIRVDFSDGNHITLKGYYLEDYFSVEKF